MRLALAIASFVVLIVHAIVFYDQFFNDWEKHQTAYFEQALGLAKTDAERAAVQGRSPRIEQHIVTQFGEARVDRCATCHIAVDDPRFKDHAQPLRTHPYSEQLGDRLVNGRWERRHKLSDFGCTVCHDGQGRGLDVVYGHGEDHYWPDPLLGFVTQESWRSDFKTKLTGTQYMEANCAQCHTEEGFTGTPNLAQGRQLYYSRNCYGCHRIEGMSSGTLGPDLSEVGKKFKIDYLWESIVEPRANNAVSFMPKQKLSEEEVRSLVIFLKSRRGLNFTETSLQRYRAKLEGQTAAPETLVAAVPGTEITPAEYGRTLVKARACAACHKIGAEDGEVAPDLSFEGLIKDEIWLMDHFRDPRKPIPDSIMPAFGFAEAEYQAMTQYMMSLNVPPPVSTPAEAYKNLCARCHGDKGDGNGMIALYLDPSPRDLTKASFMNSKPQDRFVHAIQEGVAGTSMPAWKKLLTEQQTRAVLDYVWQEFVKQPRKELKARNVPETNPVAYADDSIKRGEATYLLRCTGCHGRKADGKGPNSLDILPRPRNLRNGAFLNSVTDQRLMEAILYGVQGTAMPPWIDYGLSQKDAGDLVNYLRSFHSEK